jgi:hypothetical protein
MKPETFEVLFCLILIVVSIAVGWIIGIELGNMQ